MAHVFVESPGLLPIIVFKGGFLFCFSMTIYLGKVQKLKTAKKEADVEINKLKGEKENQFKSYEQEV